MRERTMEDLRRGYSESCKRATLSAQTSRLGSSHPGFIPSLPMFDLDKNFINEYTAGPSAAGNGAAREPAGLGPKSIVSTHPLTHCVTGYLH